MKRRAEDTYEDTHVKRVKFNPTEQNGKENVKPAKSIDNSVETANEPQKVENSTSEPRDETTVNMSMRLGKNTGEPGWTIMLRNYEENDYNKLEDLFQTITDWKHYLFPKANPILCFLQDKFGIWRAGAVVYIKNRTLKISLLAVSETHRAQGIGRTIVHYIIEKLKPFYDNAFAAVMKDEEPQKFWAKVNFLDPDKDKEYKSLLEESEQTLIIKEMKGQYPPFDGNKFGSPVHQRSLKRYVETEEELAALKENLKKMDEGIIIFDDDEDDSSFHPESDGSISQTNTEH